MSALIQNNFRVSNARKFANSFIDEVDESNFYCYVGKPIIWSAEPDPDSPQDNTDGDYSIWEEIMAMKRITSSDVVTAIRKLDWTSGKYYDMYRSDYGDGSLGQGVDLEFGSEVDVTNIKDTNFFVMTSDLNVYKCINNRDPLGNEPVASTVMPSGKSTSIFTTADGYRWKYMFTISSADDLKFNIDDFIPCRDIIDPPEIGSSYYEQWLVQEAATDGALEHILITEEGSGYTSAPTVVISEPNIPGGEQAVAVAEIVSGIVARIRVTSAGSGYKYATVTLSGGSGTGAAAKAMLSPPGGHGFNAVRELQGFNAMCYVKLDRDTGTDIPLSNQYRRVGIIKNPLLFNTSTLATATTLSATPSMTMVIGGIDDFLNDSIFDDEDEHITGDTSGAVARVVEWDPITRILRYIQTVETGFTAFEVGELVTGAISNAQWIIESLDNQEIQPFSGELLYHDNREAVTRQVGQEEVIRFVIVF